MSDFGRAPVFATIAGRSYASVSPFFVCLWSPRLRVIDYIAARKCRGFAEEAQAGASRGGRTNENQPRTRAWYIGEWLVGVVLSLFGCVAPYSHSSIGCCCGLGWSPKRPGQGVSVPLPFHVGHLLSCLPAVTGSLAKNRFSTLIDD